MGASACLRRGDGATGKPVNFLDVHISAHLAFYRACIAAVTEQDLYAGLLVSMHGAGIYRQRYGSDPNLKLTREAEALEAIDAFVDEQEAGIRGGSIGDYRLEPVAPWAVAMTPFPFDTERVGFTLLRRMLRKSNGKAAELGQTFFAVEPERVEIVIQAEG